MTMRAVIDLAERRRRRPVSCATQARINKRVYVLAQHEAARLYNIWRSDLIADVVEGVVKSDEVEFWHPRPAPAVVDDTVSRPLSPRTGGHLGV